MIVFLIFLGGGIGACCRYLLGQAINAKIGIAFPYATLTINLLGAFLIGVLLTLITERSVPDANQRALIVTGFLGGFTTFSTFTFEAVTLMRDGRIGASMLYIMGSNVLGLLACGAGIWLSRSPLS